MRTDHDNLRGGLTLIEVLITIVVLAIAITGALNYQYFSLRQTQLAVRQQDSMEIARAVLEEWKSTGGHPLYDPSLTVPDIEKTSEPGVYTVQGRQLDTMLTLSQQLTNQTNTTEIPLKELQVTLTITEDPDAESEYVETLTVSTLARMDRPGG